MKTLDWAVVGLYFLFMLVVGLYFMRRAGRSVADYFVSGRNMPWWIIALSAVATYTDAGLAPAVTMLTYQGGLLGNAVWWIPYVIWMPIGAVLWSKYWRRLGTVTSAELLGVRYGGKFAHAYRGVYAVFMSVFIVVLMGYVSGWLGAALGPILGWEPMSLILFSAIVTAVYTVTSGLYGVAYTDAYQFGIFLIGNIILVPIVLAGVGGMDNVYQMIETTRGANAEAFFSVSLPAPGLDTLTIMAFVVQGLFFAASPTGGEGFTAQRFMAAKNEFHAQVGQLFNTLLTLIIRVVPFIFLGVIAAALFAPGSVAEPGEIWARMVRSYAPTGLLGLLVAGIFAAYMSTISTQMNWGASYVVNDFYRPFVRKEASEKHYVMIGRIGSILIFAFSLFVSYYFVEGLRARFLFINSVVFAFILPLSRLRFFWWRLNIYGEAAALVFGLPLSYIVWFPLGFSNEQAHPFWQGFLLLFGLGIVTIIVVSLLTPAEKIETLREFYRRCRPPGFWGPVVTEFTGEERAQIRKETLRDVLDCVLGVAFCTAAILAVISPFGGHWGVLAASLATVFICGGLFMWRWAKRGVFRSLGTARTRNLQTRSRDNRFMKLKAFLYTLMLFAAAIPAKAAPEVHALWAHPTEAGRTAASVREFVAKCKRAHIDVIVMDVKDSNGGLYWKSKKFPQAIARSYENFDLLEHLVREAHTVGIRVDAWLVDYLEGANGAAYREHPEWVQLNPDGKTTLSEKLGKTRQYPYVWMCPAQRPGYTDQWLIPLYEEITANYKVDSLHHDYVRYPGDVAPDGYCFCDYCLMNIPRYAMLSYRTRAEERYRVTPAQPIIQANWWSDPTMIPANWDKLDRREKADFILNGRTIPGGPPDMRYFFYDYRVHQIDIFVDETAGRVKKINPKTEVSAAVFKNPILSARFIGQHWDRWNQWIDVYMPMTYRSHFAGSFEAYLEHLTETTERQLEWIGRGRPLYAGIASTYLYREELQPFDTMRDRLTEMQALAPTDVKGRAEKSAMIKAAFKGTRTRLAQLAPIVERELAALVTLVTANNGRNATAANMDQLAKRLAAFRADLPAGFLPPEKLAAAIRAARKAKPDGIAIFAAGSLDREKLWAVLETEFKD